MVVIMNDVGIVVIGRNEGQHLTHCLAAAVKPGCPVVYSDSASEDNSVEIARKFSVNVVQLDHKTPLSASRGRNEGTQKLLKINPNIKFIQFVDGDTILDERWLQHAIQQMHERPQVAIIAGELKENNPSLNIFKKLNLIRSM